MDRPPLRTVLVALAGKAPQVVTESIYALTQQGICPCIDEVWVWTTREGAREVERHLLGEASRLAALCREYHMMPPAFDREHIRVFRDGQGGELDDIRTAADNGAVADALTSFIREQASRPDIRLVCSAAGGRKTMGIFLAMALQMFGRVDDLLFHVLVRPEGLEHRPDFFYPPKEPVTLLLNGRAFCTSEAKVELAEVPLVLLRDRLPILRSSGVPVPYTDLVQRVQSELCKLRQPPELVIDTRACLVRIGGERVSFSPRERAVYVALARRRRGCTRAGCQGCPQCHWPLSQILERGSDFRREVEELLHRAGYFRSQRPEQLPAFLSARKWEDRRSDFLQVRSKADHKIQQATNGGEWGEQYKIQAVGGDEETLYGVALDPGLIRLDAG